MYFKKNYFNPNPRKKLYKEGVEKLTDQELIAILLRHGTEGNKLEHLSAKVLEVLADRNYNPDLKSLDNLPGMGIAKTSSLVAAFELSRRFYHSERFRIRKAKDILPLVNHFADRKQEHFLCASLNGGNQVINCRIITIGLINKTMVHPREVFSEAIVDRASSVICAHNHPSGDVHPSEEDKQITRNLKQAGRILGVQLLDHIIFSGNNFYSFNENDIL